MNRLLVLLLVTASIAASGCTGVPEGTAGNGTRVVIDWIARDPDTGDVLGRGNGLGFLLGTGDSGLGRDLEQSVVGRQENETYTLVSEDDESRSFNEEVRKPQFLGSDDAEGNVSISAFESSIGRPPMVNETFEFNPFYQAKVLSVGETELTYRFHLEGGEQRDAVGFVGAVLVSRIENDRLVRMLEPENGTRFSIDPPPPGSATPLDLLPGSYLTVGSQGGDIIYRRASVSNPALADRPVEFEVTVREVQSLTGGSTDLKDGKYGVRDGSPYVNGDPNSILPLEQGGVEHDHPDGADEHEDDHDDGHGHSH